MSFSPSTRAVVLVAVLAIVLPVLARVLASPLTLLILSPLLLFVLALAYLASVVYAAWFLDLNPSPSDDDLRRAARPFAFSTPAAWQVVLTRSQWSQNVPKTLPALYPESPDVSDALNDILKLIIRDFVSSWYNDLSTSPAFPIAVTAVIHASLQQLFDRATSIDASSLIVKRILPKVTAHIEQFRQSEVALRGAGLERRLTQSEELDLLLASRYASKGVKLHPAVENLSTTFTKQTEEMHLRHLVDKALPFILPAKERKSKAIRLVVREILTCTVIFPIVEMIADPDFWNKTIDQVVRWFICLIALSLLMSYPGWCSYPSTVSLDTGYLGNDSSLTDSSSPKSGTSWKPRFPAIRLKLLLRHPHTSLIPKELRSAQVQNSSSHS